MTIVGYDFPQRPFLFTDELPASGDNATSIRLLYGGGNESSYTNSSYTYDAATNLYTRMRNKRPYVDMNAADPKASLTFSNVIVQWTDLKFNGAASAPILKEVGEGNADIFTGGKHIAGLLGAQGPGIQNHLLWTRMAMSSGCSAAKPGSISPRTAPPR